MGAGSLQISTPELSSGCLYQHSAQHRNSTSCSCSSLQGAASTPAADSQQRTQKSAEVPPGRGTWQHSTPSSGCCCMLCPVFPADLERKKRSDSDNDTETTKEHLQPPQPSFTPQVQSLVFQRRLARPGPHSACSRQSNHCRQLQGVCMPHLASARSSDLWHRGWKQLCGARTQACCCFHTRFHSDVWTPNNVLLSEEQQDNNLCCFWCFVQVLLRAPPGAPAPISDDEVAAFCFPSGKQLLCWCACSA